MKTPEFKSLENVAENLLDEIGTRIKALNLPEETEKELANLLEAGISIAIIKVSLENHDECLRNARELLNV